ncbi:MAG: Bug family tripartite tricarboxylate transporter substrate binding protein [Lautropia sp.]
MPNTIPSQHPRSSARASRRLAILRSALALGVAGFAFAAHAQGFPSKPLRVIVPFPAGGPTDAIARLAADRLAPALGQPVTVMNKAGAAGGIASEFVASEPADGLTLLVAGQGQLFINKALGRKANHDPETDFKYVGMLGAFPNVLVVNPNVIPVKSIGEFIALAKREPGKLSYGSNGIGSLAHLTTESLATAAGVEFLHVPYQGAAPQMSDLLSGRIGFTLLASQAVLPHIKDGKLVPLAVTTGTRFSGLPDTPTLVEAGFPSLDAPVWFGLFVRTATPAAETARLREVFASVASSAEYRAGLGKSSAQPLVVAVGDADARFAKERRLWIDAVRKTGADKR